MQTNEIVTSKDIDTEVFVLMQTEEWECGKKFYRLRKVWDFAKNVRQNVSFLNCSPSTWIIKENIWQVPLYHKNLISRAIIKHCMCNIDSIIGIVRKFNQEQSTINPKLREIKAILQLLVILRNKTIYDTKEEKVDISGRKDISELIAPNATTVDCRGCTQLIRVELPNVTSIDCSGCIQLTKLELPLATYVDCSGCTQLTKLELPLANRIDCSGCLKLPVIED